MKFRRNAAALLLFVLLIIPPPIAKTFASLCSLVSRADTVSAHNAQRTPAILLAVIRV